MRALSCYESMEASIEHRRDTEQAHARAGDARVRDALSVLVTLYALGIGALYVLGLFGAFWKTALVPALFIIAYLARRFTAFARDWSVFLAAIVLFDNIRGLVYGATLYFGRPVYVGYVIDLEHGLFGAPVPSSRLQQALTHPGHIGGLERALVVVHASHFFAFLLFGFVLWIVRPEAFARFKVAMIALMYIGLCGYALVPTVPPWMAAMRFHAIEPVRHIPGEIYRSVVPSLAESFDINPVAAMPSLHCAFPTLIALISVDTFGVLGLPMVGYALAMWFAVVLLGEHYVVDVMAGVALAIAIYLAAFRNRAIAARAHARVTRTPVHAASPWQRAFQLKRPLFFAAALLILAQACGLSAQSMNQGSRLVAAPPASRSLGAGHGCHPARARASRAAVPRTVRPDPRP